MKFSKVLYNTFMFMLGIIIGSILDYNFNYILKRNHTISFGIVQIIINATILELVHYFTNSYPGLFALGLFTNQHLFIKKLFDYKPKIFKKKNKVMNNITRNIKDEISELLAYGTTFSIMDLTNGKFSNTNNIPPNKGSLKFLIKC